MKTNYLLIILLLICFSSCKVNQTSIYIQNECQNKLILETYGWEGSDKKPLRLSQNSVDLHKREFLGIIHGDDINRYVDNGDISMPGGISLKANGDSVFLSHKMISGMISDKWSERISSSKKSTIYSLTINITDSIFHIPEY